MKKHKNNSLKKKEEKGLFSNKNNLEKNLEDRLLELEKTNENLRLEIRNKNDIEIELRESQDLYKKIAVNFPNGSINVLDKNGCFLFAEGENLHKTGQKSEDLVGTEFMDTIDSDNKEEIKERLINVLTGVHQEFELLSHGSYYNVKAVPLYDDRKTISRMLVVETNISQQKKAEQEIYNALQKEKELGELKSKFVSMASHEFRTPLSTIMSSASLIQKYDKKEEQARRIKHVDRIKNNVSNLNMILNDFLSLEKLDTGRFKVNRENLNVMEFVESICQDFEIIKRKGQRIHVDNKLNCADCFVFTDKFLLQNALTNLLSNAVKYAENDTEITIRLYKNKKQEFCIEVEDKGRGISEEDQKMLFTRFYRAENAGEVQGTGLGLHIVKRYVDLLEGKILFISKLNHGSIFTIQLKIAE